MAAPVITGHSPLVTKTNWATSAITTNVTAPTLSVVGDELQAIDFAGAGNPYSYVEIAVEGGTVDLSDAIVELVLRQDWGASRGFSVGLSSGATANTDWKVWRYPGPSTNTRTQLFLDPTATDFTYSAGTIVASDIRRIRFQWDGNQSSRDVIISDEPLVIPKDPGLIATGGDSSDPISLKTFGQWLANTYHTAAVQLTSLQGFGDYWALPFGITIGDGSSAQVTSFDSAAVQTPLASDVGSSTVEAPLAVSSSSRRVNTSSPQTFVGVTVLGQGVGDRFTDGSPVANTFISFFARGLGTIALGLSHYQGRISAALGTVTGDGDLVVTFFDSQAATTYLGFGDLSGSEFDSPLSDYCVEFGDTFTDGATFDASGITFTSNPTVKKFKLDATGKTLNLSVGTSGITATDVEVVAGTLNIVTPIAPISIIGFPAGSTVVVSQAGQQLDLVNSQSSPYSYTPQPDEAAIYTFKVVADGNDDFITELDVTLSTVAQYIGVPKGSDQTLTSGLFEFRELMGVDTAFLRVINNDLSLRTQLWEQIGWQTEWNSAVVADSPSAAEIAVWVGYLATANYTGISVNSTGEIS